MSNSGWQRIALRTQDGVEVTLADSYSKVLAARAAVDVLEERGEPKREEGDTDAGYAQKVKTYKGELAHSKDMVNRSFQNLRKLVEVYDLLRAGKLQDFMQLADPTLFEDVEK